jgi:hypothetical protein
MAQREVIAWSQAAYTFENTYGIFMEISAFFLGKDKTIYYKRNRDFFFNKDNYQKVFNQSGYYYPSLKLIEVFYKLLALNKEERLFWQYEMYKRANNATYCVFDNPEFFLCYEDNIYFDTGEQKILLNTNNYQEPVNFNNRQKGPCLHRGTLNKPFDKLRQPSIKQFRSIISMIKPYVSSHNELKIRDNSKQVLMQYMIQYLQKKHGMFESISIFSEPVINTGLRYNIGQNGEYILQFMREISTSNHLPMSFIQYLLMLTDGHLRNIDQLAKFIARTNLTKIVTEKEEKGIKKSVRPKLIVIVTPNLNLMQKLLADIYLSEQTIVQNTSHLCSDKGVADSVKFKLDSGILHIMEKGMGLTDKDMKRLGKLIRSMPVIIKDYVVGRITYISNSQYLLIVEKQEDLNIYTNYLSKLVEVIVLQGNKVEEKIMFEETVKEMKKKKIPLYLNIKDFPVLSSEDSYWVETVFAMYGLTLLCEENKMPLVGIENSLNNKSIVDYFIEECCTQSDQVDCYADELYGAYKQYFNYYYRVEPIKRTQLVNIIKLNNRYRYHRLRHSVSDNKWGFTGLTINKEKMEKYNLSEVNGERKKDKIKDYIRNINQKVIPLFLD